MIRESVIGKHNLVNQPSVGEALQITFAAAGGAAALMAVFCLILKWQLIPQLALIAAASSASAILLHRSGFVAQGLLLGVLGILYAVMHAAATNDGIQSVGLAIIPMLIVIASLLLGRRSLVFFTASVILAAVGMLAIRYYALRIETYSNNDLGDFLIFAVTCATAAVMGRILSRAIERGIAEEKDRFSAIIDSITDEVWFADANRRIVLVNPAVLRNFGVSGSEALEIEKVFNNFEIFRPDGSPLPIQEVPLLRGLRGDVLRNTEDTVRMPGTGELRNRLVNACPVTDASGIIIGSVSVVRDITEYKRTEEELRDREQRLNSIYNTVGDIIFQLEVESGGQFRFVFANAAFARVTGLSMEAVVGKTVNEIVPEPSLTMVLGKYRQAVEEKCIVRWQETSDYPAGRLTGEVSVAPVCDSTGRCTHLVGSVHDVTQRKRAEEQAHSLQLQLAHAQKMESIGRLAGGLAHDFNNILSVILLHSQSALQEMSIEDSKDSLTAIQDAAEKAIALGRQLMAFSSKHMLETEVLSLNSVIADTQQLVRRLIGEDIEVVFKPASWLPFVRADRGQLGQIIINLAVNSRDAMPKGGTFTLETASVEFDDADALLNPEAPSGPYVMLSVRDTGIGMGKETLTRLFEPFFTTKAVGKGTGLGLSVVYGIVRQSSGFITVDSEPGHGTEFRIYLPAVVDEPKPILHTEKGPIQGGSETILLVEDEPVLRKAVHKMLDNAGYSVLVAPDGEEARRLAALHTLPIHLLLTDVVMPGLSGPRLAEGLLTLRREMKVLYMSGYPDPGDGSITPQLQPNLIEKPFTTEQLLGRVREALD